MKHLFASGEEFYKRNLKVLEQGTLKADYLNYEEISEDAVYEAVGIIDCKAALVRFKIKSEDYKEIKFKHTVRILMQSDLLAAEWEYCEVNFL